ncbi:MAG: SURF1 family protein [Chromatiales bacterium]|jgi:surfeit locus 1 family protein
MRFGNIEFRPGLIPTIVFVLVLPFLLSLGVWQLNRAAEKQQVDAERQTRQVTEQLELNLLDSVESTDRYRPARVTGEYVNDRHWLLDNQVANGRVGYHAFSLFRMQGQAEKYVLVDRGWVALGPDRKVLPDVTAPAGQQILHGRLDRPASVGIRMGQADYKAVTVLPYLDIADFASAMSLPVLQYALVLDEGQPGLLRRDWEQVAEMTPEKHIGYAVQWFALAFALVVIYVGVNSRKIKRNNPDAGSGRQAGHE